MKGREVREFEIDICTHCYLKWIINKDLRTSAQYYVAAWMGGEFGENQFSSVQSLSRVQLFVTP